MKVYSCPNDVPAPEVDYMNYDIQKVSTEENAHKEDLKEWLVSSGYSGENTGRILSEQVADGYAHYMFAEKEDGDAILIHLPYGDGYQKNDVKFLPKEEVLDRIDRSDKLAELFERQRQAAQERAAEPAPPPPDRSGEVHRVMVTIEVLAPDAESARHAIDSGLSYILEEADSGELIAGRPIFHSSPVGAPDSEIVRKNLLRLGNDGTFFDEFNPSPKPE